MSVMYLDYGTSVCAVTVEGANLPSVPDGAAAITAQQYRDRRDAHRAATASAQAAQRTADAEAEAKRAAEAAAVLVVRGPVTDSSFPADRPPVDGTMAVDELNRRMYFRVSGTWLSAPLT